MKERRTSQKGTATLSEIVECCSVTSIDWLIAWSTTWFVSWLIAWSVDWLIESVYFDLRTQRNGIGPLFMAGVCCGSVKRTKSNKMDGKESDCSSTKPTASSCSSKDGHGLSNGLTTTMNLALITPRTERLIVCHEMCHFCFDVLYAYLHRHDPPETPNTFPNEP
jgi:hypothetical protein